MIDTIREQLLAEVREFFVGPRNDNELLPRGNTPLDMYNAGILFPASAPHEDMDDEGKEDGEGGNEDPNMEVESRVFFKQNSIGLRVKLNKESKIRLVVKYGKYDLNEDGIWERHGHGHEYDIDLLDKDGKIELMDDTKSIDAKIWWKLHKNRTLNIFFENARTWTELNVGSNEEKMDYQDIIKINNQNSIFQPFMSLEKIGDKSPFDTISTDSNLSESPEDDLFDMLYRNERIFGSGYACAVEWEDRKEPSYVRTTTMPVFQADETEKFSEDDNERPSKIDMYHLCCFNNLQDHDSNRQTIKKRISPIIEEYRKWIMQQNKKLETNSIGTDDEIARSNMEQCMNVLGRMEDGLTLLTNGRDKNSEKILKAFILANRAMFYQRLHFTFALSNFKNKGKLKWPKEEPNEVFWYPFQIAFILMSLRGIAYKHHKDSSIADLIWFPTGGGKTEAYLGVAAFTMILRRLRGDIEDGLGVSIIMRYTLRLLTLQQFERASTLVCALEYLRRKVKDSGLGKEPFLLGLWVGYSLTPNHHDISDSALKQLKDNPSISTPDGSPCQVNYCPWCGHGMAPYPNYRFDNVTKWTLIRCTNDTSPCIFTDKNFAVGNILPLVTVDSDIYSRCPSMIIATVDKFAQMPFKTDIANIFGKVQRKCDLHGFLPREKRTSCGIEGEGVHRTSKTSRVRNIQPLSPPDLIIQDELHLISGPLGTMVGLYEIAVDFLASTNVAGKITRPKIIVSTATIKGAQDQVKKIFNRELTQSFPPPGIDRRDSFFWWKTGKKGKIFAGMSFSQRSGKYALSKLYASLLQKTQNIRSSGDISDHMLDPYWTLVGYYNSIRELGGSNRLVEDDVVQHMNFLTSAIHQSRYESRLLGTPEDGIYELTGRKTQREINEIRTNLEKSLPDRDVISVLLATNMISVGIDIDRLALMAVNGQPKTVTEYIQATGRIGRRSGSPGSVFILFNPHKSRDLSHYENFIGFHSTMQRHIEPSTLTPFSIPSYNRALHAVLIAMIRHTNQYLAENNTASNFKISDGKIATNFILDRFKAVEQVDDSANSYIEFKKRLDTLQEEWEKFSEDVENDTSVVDPIWYYNPYDKWKNRPKNPNVLMAVFAERGGQKSDRFPLSTPESLRDVEQHIEMVYV